MQKHKYLFSPAFPGYKWISLLMPPMVHHHVDFQNWRVFFNLMKLNYSTPQNMANVSFPCCCAHWSRVQCWQGFLKWSYWGPMGAVIHCFMWLGNCPYLATPLMTTLHFYKLSIHLLFFMFHVLVQLRCFFSYQIGSFDIRKLCLFWRKKKHNDWAFNWFFKIFYWT